MTRGQPVVVTALALPILVLAACGEQAVTAAIGGEAAAPQAADAATAAQAEPVMDRLYRPRLEADGDRFVSLRVFGVAVDRAAAADPARYVVTSPDDPAYAAERARHPARAGSRTRTVRLSERRDLLLQETRLVLELPEPLRDGCSYGVRVDAAVGTVPELPALRYDAQRVSDVIRVNQVGYLPGRPKHAYVGEYLGDLGPMPIAAESFELLDDDGVAVFTAPLQRRAINEDRVGQQVHDCDFSAFETEGRYRIHVPGIGVSHPFRIGAGALNPLFATYMRGLYHQRCGVEIPAGFSRHARIACHLDDAATDAGVAKTKFVEPKRPPLHEPSAYGRRFHAVHGHHDAGDYGKYTISGAGFVGDVLNAFTAFPERFASDATGLPCSGNGIPDLLDECVWELDWLEGMQDEDGGVFGVIRPQSGGYEHHMPTAEARRWMFPKDTVFTAAFAAAMARAARSPEIARHHPEAPARYLERARRAWAWLERNDRFTEYFHYGAVFGDWDERCWAALELYAATGEQTFHDYFLREFRPDEKKWNWWALFEAVGRAVHSYVLLDEERTHPGTRARCVQALMAACDDYIADAAQDPYRLSMPGESVTHGTYGWMFPGAHFGFDLLIGYRLSGDERYLDCAVDNLGYSAGANPGGFSLVTGIGAKRNVEVVDNESTHDGIVEPVPGIPLGIGTHGFTWLARYGKRPGQGNHPADWPLMNRWYDGFNVSTEFTTPEQGREALVAAFFAQLPPEGVQRPRVRITADVTRGTAPLTVRFGIETHAGVPVDQVFWDFDDETFSTAEAPVHRFDEDGRVYRVAVGVIDADGGYAYDTVRILARAADAAHPVAPRAIDDDTLALFRFDGSMDDAVPSPTLGLRKVAGDNDHAPVGFAAEAPLWMDEPSGTCLLMHGHEQLVIELPPALLERPLAVEALVYLDDGFAGWGYKSELGADPIVLGLRRGWKEWAGLQQGTWDKTRSPAFGSKAGKALAPAELQERLPRQRWIQLGIVVDRAADQVALAVDGREIARCAAGVTGEGDEPYLLTVGPLRGMLDELCVRRVAAAAVEPPADAPSSGGAQR